MKSNLFVAIAMILLWVCGFLAGYKLGQEEIRAAKIKAIECIGDLVQCERRQESK